MDKQAKQAKQWEAAKELLKDKFYKIIMDDCLEIAQAAGLKFGTEAEDAWYDIIVTEVLKEMLEHK